MLIHIFGDSMYDTDLKRFISEEETIESCGGFLDGEKEKRTIKRKRKEIVAQPKKEKIYKYHRNSKIVVAWKRSILERDNNTCQECGSKDDIHVHHIIRFSKSKLEDHSDLSSGISLCVDCHRRKHPELPNKLFTRKTL